MAKITWLGEPDGPGVTVWNGVEFPAGVPVETSNPYFARKAAGNPFFLVEPDDPPSADGEKLAAVHRGRGSWSIMRGAAEVQSGMTKADAEVFNALTDDEKEAFVGGGSAGPA